MMIVKNQSYHEVKITLMGVLINILPNDEVLIDSGVGENLRETQPQLEYLEVSRSDEDEVEKRFKKKKVDDRKAIEEAKAKEEEQIKEMEEYRAKMAKKKADERAKKVEKKVKTVSKKAPVKKVAGKPKANSKKVTEKK